MMCDRERACKDGAGFSVLALAVAEEERVACGIPVGEAAGLSHEAAGECRRIGHRTAGGDDEIFAYDAPAYGYGGVGGAVDGSVGKERGPWFRGTT